MNAGSPPLFAVVQASSSLSMRATAWSISTRRSAVASGPPASVSGPAPRHTMSIRPTRWISSAEATMNPLPDRLGARHPVADLAPEHDQIDARIAREPPRGRLVDGRQRHDQLRARLPQPRDLFLRGRDRILALAAQLRSPAPGRRRRTRRPGRRPRSAAATARRAGDGGRLTASRAAHPGRPAAHVGLGQPGRERPELDQLRRQEARPHRVGPLATSWCCSPGTTARPRPAPAPRPAFAASRTSVA